MLRDFALEDYLFDIEGRRCISAPHMKQHHLLILPLISIGVSLPVSAALVWTGGGDGISLYAENNWQEDDGTVPEANEINSTVAITADTGGQIEITSGSGSPSNFGGNFNIGSGNSILISNGKVLGSSGASGMTSGSVESGTIDGATVNLQFVVNVDWTLDNGAVLRLRGDGNPLNTSTVNVLDNASVLRFDDEEYAGTGNFDLQHSSKVTFQGNALVFGADPFAVEPGDNALASPFNPDNDGNLGVEITFVPEPSSALMLLMSCLILGRRSR